MSRIRRVLVIHTSLGSHINYTLQATLPPYMLTKCAAALPRPQWEALLFYISLGLMTIFGFGIVGMAYFESDRIYTNDIMHIQNLHYDKSKVFDLRMTTANKESTSNGNTASPGSPVTVAASAAAMSNGHSHPIKAIASSGIKSDNCVSSVTALLNGGNNGHVTHDKTSKISNGKKNKDPSSAAAALMSGLSSIIGNLYKRFTGYTKTTSKKRQDQTPERQTEDTHNNVYNKSEQENHSDEQQHTTKQQQQQATAPPLFIRQKKGKGTKRQLPYEQGATANAMAYKDKKGSGKRAAAAAASMAAATSTEKMSNGIDVGLDHPDLSAIKAELDNESTGGLDEIEPLVTRSMKQGELAD